jgi:hypothetical protein
VTGGIGALLAAAALVPAHVLSWYYYGLNGVNASVPAAVMVRYADFVEDDGFSAEHAMAFKRAGGRWATAYTDPAYVPYCHPPFAPPGGHCEGPIGDLVTSEDAWFHGPDGTRVRRYVDKEFDHQEALNPASASARRAWRNKTERLLRAAPALDFLFADDSGSPLRAGDMSPTSAWFYGFNTGGVEITGDAAFRDAWIAYLSTATLPVIVNGADPVTGLPAYDGAFLRAPRVLGAAQENCFNSSTGITTDAHDRWRYHADGLLATTRLHRWAACFMTGRPTQANRMYTLASWWITYDPDLSIAAPLEPVEKSSLLPELDIVPREPIRSAHEHARELRTDGGAYVREFRSCYQREAPLGGCAAIVNSTASTLPLPRLEGRYGQTLALEGADVVAGGRATWRRGVPATLAPGSALIVAR